MTERLDIKKLVELRDKATPGDWRVTNSGTDRHHFKWQIGTHERTVGYGWCPNGCSEARKAEASASADFMAAAPTMLRELITLSDEKRELAKVLIQFMEDMSGGTFEFPGHSVCQAAWNEAAALVKDDEYFDFDETRAKLSAAALKQVKGEGA